MDYFANRQISIEISNKPHFMKNLLKFIAIAFVATSITLTSCVEDPIVEDVAPQIDITFGKTYADQTWDPGFELGPITIEADTGSSPLKALYIEEDGVKIPIADQRVKKDGDYIAGNPLLIVTETDGFSYDMSIVLDSEEATHTYSFVVEDENGLTDKVDLVITTEITFVPTPFDTVSSAIFYNFDGLMEGCIDVETGIAYLVADDAAAGGVCDLMDTGLDPITFEWAKKITGKNNATLKSANGVAFSDLTSYEDLQTTWENALDVADNTIDSAEGTEVLVEDKDGNLFAVTIDSIVETDMDNNDNYTITVLKKGS